MTTASIMLRLRLKWFLRQHGLSEADLADAMAEVVIDWGRPVSERYLRYLIGNTGLITPNNRLRKPSLVILGLIIRALRHLTGTEVQITDILVYEADASEADWFEREAHDAGPNEQRKTQVHAPASAPTGHQLVSVTAVGETDESFMRIEALAVQRLKQAGFPDLAAILEAAGGSEAAGVQGRSRAPLKTRWLIGMVITLLVVVVTVTAYEQAIVRPRLFAVRGGIFSFRDRLQPTSGLPLPTLIGPEGTIHQLAPVLRASPVQGAIAYEFYVKNEVSDDGVYTGPIPSSSFSIPEGTLCPSTSYAWRIRVLGQDGWTSFSSAMRFSVSEDAVSEGQRDLIRLAGVRAVPSVPTIHAPLGTVHTLTPVLDVEADPDAMGYGFYIRDLQTDRIVYNNDFARQSRVEVPEGVLRNQGIYQWNARSRNCHYWSEFTPAEVFTVEVIPE